MLMGCYPPDLGSEPPSRRNNRHGNVDYGGQHHATQSRPGRQWIYRVRARRLASLKAISKTSRAAVSRVRVRRRVCSPRPSIPPPGRLGATVGGAGGGGGSRERQAMDGLAGFLREQGREARKFAPPNGAPGGGGPGFSPAPGGGAGGGGS